jgi:O-antigen/teichoic acid export membrane protein
VSVAARDRTAVAKSVGSAGLQVFRVRIVVEFLVAGSGIFVTRGLGPHDKGLFLDVWLVLWTVLRFTAGDVSVAWLWGKQRSDQRDVFGAGLMFGAGVYMVAAIGLACAALAIPGQRILWAVIVALPFAIIAQFASGFFMTEQRVGLVNAQDALTRVGVGMGAAIAVYLFHDRLLAVLVVFAGDHVILGLFSIVALLMGARLLPLRTTWLTVKEYSGFAIQAGGQQALAFLNHRVDVVMVAFLLGPLALGIYSVALAINELLWLFARVMGIAAFSKITTGGFKESAELTARCVRHGLIVSAVGGLAAGLAASLVPFVYGGAFERSILPLRILLPGVVAWSSIEILTIFFTTQCGRPMIMTIVQGLSASICALVIVLFAHSLGLIAAAIGASLGYLVAGSVAVVMFSRVSGLSVARVLLPTRQDLNDYLKLVVRVRTSLPSSP